MRVVNLAELPQPGPGQVRVRVAYAGVNRPDVLQRAGLYPPPPGASPHLGLEVSGSVDAVGEQVGNTAAGSIAQVLQFGQPVCALTAGGGYADYVCVPAAHLMRVPAGLSLQEAAALPETGMTVWANVFERCSLSPGEVFFVHAGASSIGLTTIAMAKAAGAVVLASVSSDEKARACMQAGADAVFDYAAGDWVSAVRSWLKGQGFDGLNVVLDMLGGGYTSAALGLMAVEGRLATIAQLNGGMADIDLSRVMVKRLTITGSTLRARTDAYKAHLASVLQERVWPKLEAGIWKPVIHAVVPVSDVQQAHGVLERRENCGKVLLQF